VTKRGFSFICVDFVFMVFLVKDECLFVLDMIYSCGVKLSFPVIGTGVLI